MLNNFIYTMDKATAERLIKQGYILIRSENNTYTFANDVSRNFDNMDKSLLLYTNRLRF